MEKDKKENTTKYGEFVSSYFGWVTPKQQKDRVEELEKITQKDKKERKN